MKNKAAVALAKIRMKKISPERRMEISRNASIAAGVVHHNKAVLRRENKSKISLDE
jgi:hypothetical protein